MKTGQLAFPLRIPFVDDLGLELWACADGQAELRLDLRQRHLNSWAVAHGGVLMTLLDVAMAHAARSVNLHANPANAGGGGPGMATIEMKTSFLQAAQGPLRATGRLMHKTVTMAFCEGSVFDASGRLCAHATATFKYLRALPTGGRQSHDLQRATPAAPNPESV